MNRSRSLAALIALLPLAMLVAEPIAAQNRDRRERPDRPIPGRQRADPGRVAATDIAFARAARDIGQWTAFREYAAPRAQMHEADGPTDAAAFLLARGDPPEPLRWAPTEVWSSCDGSLAVSFGRSRRPDGIVGSYVTVWQREGGRSADYRWVYATGTPDNPQPPPPPVEIAPNGDTIIVTELSAIQARAADCVAVDALPQDGLSALTANVQTEGGTARDGTLKWRWEHLAPGQWRVVVDWVREGVWTEALAFDIPEG